MATPKKTVEVHLSIEPGKSNLIMRLPFTVHLAEGGKLQYQGVSECDIRYYIIPPSNLTWTKNKNHRDKRLVADFRMASWRNYQGATQKL